MFSRSGLCSLVRAGVVVAMSEYPDKEELYLLRVQDPSAADSLRKLLHKPGPPPSTPPLEIRFNNKEGADPQARTGSLIAEGTVYQAKRLDLPTIVECFKTYDDCNLVKSCDIGQVILVPPPGQDLPEGVQAQDGVTPPMRDAVNRRFRKLKHVEPGLMRHVEEAILTIASGQAPEGYEFIDEEEEFIVASNGRSGSWQPYQPGQSEQQPVNPPQKIPVKRKTKKKSKMQEAIQQDNGGDMEDI